MQLYSPSHAYQISINTLEIGYNDSVLSANAVLIHDRLLWSPRHNFILIYVRVFVIFVSIIRLGESIDFNLTSLTISDAQYIFEHA